ncbi:hypothetical protein [Nocardiopsis flavescens]|uniref:hypothetical protein n=1 Tax=Nocardiopsis flavescens TaxID=758803 RepID=UPI0011610DC6|nr:hypothetical protein [Nocardiopsis flavescens]
MTAGKKRPPWVKTASVYDRYIDIRGLIPSIGDVPRMINSGALAGVRKVLDEAGFRVSEAFLGELSSERVFAGRVLRSMGLWEKEEAAWGLFVDRIWDFYREGGDPVLVAIHGVDKWMLQDFKLGVRCIFKSAAVLDSLVPELEGRRRQIEFVFLGDWEGVVSGV